MSPNKLDEAARGVYIISATPFTDNGEVDFESADRLVDFYIEKGVSGITVLGMMGEAQKMAPEESVAFLERIMRRAGSSVPVVVGVSDAGLDNLVRLAKISMDKGAAGVMVAPLPGLATEEKMYHYFSQVFDGARRRYPGVLPGLSAGDANRNIGSTVQPDGCGIRATGHVQARRMSRAHQSLPSSAGIGRRSASGVHPGRQWRPVSAAGTGAGCRRCNDRFCLSRNAGCGRRITPGR